MSFTPNDYELSIRSVEPTYRHTLPRDANRKDTDHETHLSRIDVEVQLRDSRLEYDESFTGSFTVDHEHYDVRFKTVGSSHDRTQFNPERYYYVSHFMMKIVEDFLGSVGLQYDPPVHTVTMWDDPPEPSVHTEMDVQQTEAADD